MSKRKAEALTFEQAFSHRLKTGALFSMPADELGEPETHERLALERRVRQLAEAHKLNFDTLWMTLGQATQAYWMARSKSDRQGLGLGATTDAKKFADALKAAAKLSHRAEIRNRLDAVVQNAPLLTLKTGEMEILPPFPQGEAALVIMTQTLEVFADLASRAAKLDGRALKKQHRARVAAAKPLLDLWRSQGRSDAFWYRGQYSPAQKFLYAAIVLIDDGMTLRATETLRPKRTPKIEKSL